MVNTKATEWINRNYPINGTCQRKEDKENYGKTRKEIISLDISNHNLEGELDLSGFINLEKLNCSYNLLDNLEFLNQLTCPEKLIFLNIDNCSDRFFFQGEIEEKVKPFKNLIKLTPDLERYQAEQKKSESYGDLLSGMAGNVVKFAKKRGQEWMLLKEIENEKQKAKELEKSLRESEKRDNAWEEKMNELEEIRNSLGSMNKATTIIINSDDPDQVFVRLCPNSEEKANDEEIGTDDSSEDRITLNVREVETQKKLENLKELRRQILYGQAALESVLKHEKLQKFQKSLSNPFREAYQNEQEIKSKSFNELKNDFNYLWKGSDRAYNPMDLDKIKLIIDELVKEGELVKKELENKIDLSKIKEEIENNLAKNKEEYEKVVNSRWAWNEYNEYKDKANQAEILYHKLKEKNSTFVRFQDINYYGSKNAEIYMLYTQVLKKELPEYIEKVKEKLGTKFVRFNEKFKKVKEESFGDYVAKKLADSDDFYFSPDRVWKEIESAKEEILGQILDLAPTMQYQPSEDFSDGVEEVIKESYYTEKNYQEKGIIYENRRFPWKINKDTLLAEESLPTRLYDISEKKIKVAKKIKNYAILSYVWGKVGELTEAKKERFANMWGEVGYKNELNPSGYKALYKGIEACQLLGIDYLWMDQLCTNQGDNEDKNREVPKMRQYYSNSSMTLVSIDGNLHKDVNLLPSLPDTLKKIINSEWFTRSWTFQEGWLSKQTIFMFDDGLVDGRAVCQAWVLNQPVYTKFARYNSLEEAAEASKKIATPLGWVYYKSEYDLEDKVDLSLGQVLKEIKNRGRGAPVDGVYSILGLLPYGSEVKVNYKSRICPECPEKKEAKNCKHQEKIKQWATYSKKDIAGALYEVMKTAVVNGYGELFAWHGESTGLMPEVINERGSTDMRGGLMLVCKCEKSHKEFDCEKCKQGISERHDHDFGCVKIKDIIRNENGFISYGNVEVKGTKYMLEPVMGSGIVGMEESKGFLIEGGLHKREVFIKGLSETVALTGSKETLKTMQKDDLLIMLDKDRWESESPFAILVAKTEKDNNIFYRKGIVGFDGKNEVGKMEKLEVERENLIIDNEYDIQLDAIEKVEEKLKSYGLSERALGERWKFSFRGKVREKIHKEKEKLLNLAEEVKEWFETIKSLNPSEDCEFVLWLRNEKELAAKQALENLQQLKEEYLTQKLEAKIEVNK